MFYLKNNSQLILKTLSLSLFIVILSSCTKKHENEYINAENAILGKASITVVVEGIAENSEKDFRKTNLNLEQSAYKNTKNRSINVAVKENLVSLGELDALVSFNNDSSNLVSPENQNQSLRSGITDINDNSAKLSKLKHGIKYRLIIYDQKNALIVNRELISGSAPNPEIRVDGHRDYKWYALSINESVGTVPNINDRGLITSNNLANKDVIYASGELKNTEDGNNYIGIRFTRKTAKIQVEVNVRGLFSTINNATTMSLLNNGISAIQTGDFNISTGNFSNIKTVNSIVLGSEMTQVQGEPLETVKTANFHTINTTTIAAKKLQLRFNSLKVNTDDFTERGGPRTFSNNLTYTFNQGYTPAIGVSYTVSMRLIESPVKVKGILWSRGNLRYDNSKTDKHRIKANSNGSPSSTKDSEFWNWYSLTPTSTNSEGDPCLSVYPVNTWRMPTKAEWERLGQPDKQDSYVPLFTLLSGNVQYWFIWNKDTDQAPNPAYDDDDFLLPFGGYRSSPNIFGTTSISGSPAGIGGLATGNINYWTSNSYGKEQATAIYSSFTTAFWIISWSNAQYSNFNKNQGRNIRCVRQAEYNSNSA